MRLQAALSTIRHLQNVVHNDRRIDIRIRQICFQWVWAILQDENVPTTFSHGGMVFICKDKIDSQY